MAGRTPSLHLETPRAPVAVPHLHHGSSSSATPQHAALHPTQSFFGVPHEPAPRRPGIPSAGSRQPSPTPSRVAALPSPHASGGGGATPRSVGDGSTREMIVDAERKLEGFRRRLVAEKIDRAGGSSPYSVTRF